MNTLEVGPTITDPLGGVLEWGIRIIEGMQAALPSFFEPLFVFFTVLGEPGIYLVIIALLFWCIDERVAARCGIVLFVSAGINTAIKETLAIPRPFIKKPGINRIMETGFSTPSGHSQNSAAFWPVLLQSHEPHQRRLRIIASIGLPAVIGISRIYLGVHYPTDVLLGWALGAGIAFCSLIVLPVLARTAWPALHTRFPNLSKTPVSIKIAGVATFVFLLNEFSGGDTRMSGVLFGYSAGYLLLTENSTTSPRFSAAAGSLVKKSIRFFLGLAGIVLIYLAGNAFCNFAGAANLAVCRFVQFALAGFWISRLAPELFVKIGLQ